MNEQSIKTLKDKVEFILKNDPPSRNSDIRLTACLWVKFHSEMLHEQDGERYIKLKDLFDLPREDNIKRVRAKLQNEEGKYVPTSWKVAEKRGFLEAEWKKALGYKVDSAQ